MDKQTQDSQEQANNRNLKHNNQTESSKEHAAGEQNAEDQSAGAEDKTVEKRRRIRNLPLLIAEICVLLISVGIMYVVFLKIGRAHV